MADKLPPRTKFNNFGKLLTISAVDERDGGKYTCTAENSAGKDIHYFDVIVEGRSASGDHYACICGCICFCFKEEAVDTRMAVVLTQTNTALLNISQSHRSG